jgi:single-strand selective monofunctional uracil DNA glycosylase
VATVAFSHRLVAASRNLARDAGRLRFASPVRCTYNPLVYARTPHESYLAKYADAPKRVVFLGMNPGPWGMAQTGVPFGEVSAVRDWLQLSGSVAAPAGTHPRVAVRGFDCPRSEVSGRRLWGLFRETFGTAEQFAVETFVSNYCPLMFLDDSGRNITPDRIGRQDQAALFALCDRFLSVLIDVLQPEWLIGVGKFAEQRIRAVLQGFPGTSIRVTTIMHPSPANPRSQQDWAGQVRASLEKEGVWKKRKARRPR